LLEWFFFGGGGGGGAVLCSRRPDMSSNFSSDKYKGNMKLNLSSHGHNINNLNCHVEFGNTVLFQKNVVDMGIKLYNKVPESTKKMCNFKLFKKD
jgi:hypothetical protein